MNWKRITSILVLLCLLSTLVMPTASAVKATTADRLSTPMVGIDVSSWNQEIDWAKVKAAGVEFAIVRIFHHLKNTPNYELDEQFERNVREAQKYGIQLGAYFFSYAQTLDAITTEANMVVNELNKYPGVFTFPIVFDAEDGDTTDDPNVSGNDIYDIGSFAGAACKNFCSILSANGYYPMVYSYTWYFEEMVGLSNVKDFDLWLASYPRSGDKQIYAGTGPANAGSIDHSKRDKLSSYDSNVTMWQYTGAGKIDGIYYGDGGAIVDLNVCYVDYPSIIKSGGYNGFKANSFQTKPLTYRTGANGAAATYKSSKYYDHVTSIGLTGDGVTDTLAAALSQLGYYEGTSSNPYSGLYNTYDTYTSNKTTEYVYNYGDADSSGYKMAWCASFCSWALFQARVTDHATHAQSCRNNIGNSAYIWRECSCYQWADQLKRFSRYSERGTYTPKAGDLIFFKMEGGGTAWTNHIGLVRYCDGSKVYTVEGNRQNHVGLYSYSLSDSQICGYGKLPYPTNSSAPKVDYTGKNKTAGRYITNNVTLSVSGTKGGAAAFTIGKYEMFDVTGFDGSYALVTYNGKTGYATLNSNTIQVTATSSAYAAQGMNVSVDAASIKKTSYAGGSKIPTANNNAQNPNVYITGLKKDSNCYKGLENFGSNKDKIMINGRTWTKWESRGGAQILKNIWVYGTGDGKAYLGIDIGDTTRLRVQGASGYGEEIETIVIKRGFEIVQTTSNLWSSGEISSGSYGSDSVVGVFKENVILVANGTGGFDVHLGGSSSLGLEGYTFKNTNPKYMKVNADANIRSGPAASYASIGIAYNGETYEYLDEAQGNFHKIDYKGQVAWISVYNGLSTLTEVSGTVTVTSYELNIRSGPGTSYSILGTASTGEKFEYLGETQNDKWMKVNYNGQIGWISNVNASLEAPDYVVEVTAKNADWAAALTPVFAQFGSSRKVLDVQLRSSETIGAGTVTVNSFSVVDKVSGIEMGRKQTSTAATLTVDGKTLHITNVLAVGSNDAEDTINGWKNVWSAAAVVTASITVNGKTYTCNGEVPVGAVYSVAWSGDTKYLNAVRPNGGSSYTIVSAVLKDANGKVLAEGVKGAAVRITTSSDGTANFLQIPVVPKASYDKAVGYTAEVTIQDEQGNTYSTRSSSAYTTAMNNLPAYYAVTFMDGEAEYQKVFVNKDKTVAEPATAPAKEGFEFKGWYNGETAYDFAAAVTDNLTLTAKWEEIPTVEKTDFAFARMILGNALDMQFAFPKEGVESGAYVEVVRMAADGGKVAQTIPYAEFKSATISGVAHYYVTYSGIAAKEMADTIVATVYNKNGNAISNGWTDSVREYALRSLRAEGATTKNKTMLVDMLNYGAAAQVYFTYNADDLANCDLTAEELALDTAAQPCVNEVIKGTKNKGSRLILESSIKVQQAFSGLNESMYATVEFTNYNGREISETIPGSEFQLGATSIIELDQIVLADARTLYTLTIYNADGTVYDTHVDSVASYIARASDNALYDAIMNFADGAYNYFS